MNISKINFSLTLECLKKNPESNVINLRKL